MKSELDLPPPHDRATTLLWLIGISLITALYFFMYFSPATLHDAVHYAASGVSMVRDHKDLIYPYNPQAPGGLGPAYDYFQDGTIHFGSRTNYPAKLYSLLYGLIYSVTGKVRLEYLHWMSLSTFLAGNILLYLIGRRYFAGTTLFLLLMAIMLLPLTRTAINPGTDGIGYTSALFLYWLILCRETRPIVVGIVTGILAHSRSQLIGLLFTLPFLYAAAMPRQLIRQTIAPLSFGFALAYFSLAVGFGAFSETSTSSPVQFYVHHFKQSFYGFSEFGIIVRKFAANVVGTFGPEQLFVYAAAAVTFLVSATDRFVNRLTIGALFFVSLPILTYSLDRYSAPHPRYFLAAAPLIAIAAFSFAEKAEKNGYAGRRVPLAACFVILCAWYTSLGIDLKALNPATIKARLEFLDFAGAQKALEQAFDASDIIIINHSLPTALFPMNNVLMVPAYTRFYAGDNRRVAGIVFTFGEDPPNNFFTPRDWMQSGTLPLSFTDAAGTSFVRVYEGTSILPVTGAPSQKTYLYIYTRE